MTSPPRARFNLEPQRGEALRKPDRRLTHMAVGSPVMITCLGPPVNLNTRVDLAE